MKLLKDIWYEVKSEDSDSFIKDLIDTLQIIDSRIVLNHNAIILLCSGAVDHLYIRYKILNNKPSINYRTSYNSLYMNRMNKYKVSDEPTLNKEEKKMCYEKYSHKELLNLKWEEEKSALEDKRILSRELVINNTEIAKAALAYINAVKTYTKITHVPTVEQLVTYDMLPLDVKEVLDSIETTYNKKYTELMAKYQTINSLISLADTYEQKIDILTRYDIVKLPKKTKN